MTVLRKLSSRSRILEKFRNQFYFLKTTKSLTLFILFIGIWQLSHSQDYIEFHIDQPVSLQVDAGVDKTIKEGEHVQIGGVPAAKEGNGDYIYEWSPTSGIDEVNAANPSIKPSETTSYTLFVTDKHECTASDDVKITVESTSTIKDQTKNPASFTVFPNPAKNSLFVNLENYKSQKVTITLLNASGKIIHEEKLEVAGEKKIPFNFIQVDPGIYFIQINSGSDSTIQKIILE